CGLARAGRGDGRPRAAHQHHPAAAHPRWPLRLRDPERHRAGDLVPVLPPARPAHGAHPPPLRVRRVARVHRDRALLAARRAPGRAGARLLLRRLHPHPGGARLMRVLVIGLATTGASVVAYTRAAGHEVTVLEDRPPTPGGNRLQQQDGYRDRAEQAVAAGARLVESPTDDEAAALGRAADLVVPS